MKPVAENHFSAMLPGAEEPHQVFCYFFEFPTAVGWQEAKTQIGNFGKMTQVKLPGGPWSEQADRLLFKRLSKEIHTYQETDMYEAKEKTLPVEDGLPRMVTIESMIQAKNARKVERESAPPVRRSLQADLEEEGELIITPEMEEKLKVYLKRRHKVE